MHCPYRHCSYCGQEMESISRYSGGKYQTIFLGTSYGCTKCDKMFDQTPYLYLPGVGRPIPVTKVKWEEREDMKWSTYKKKNPKEKVVRPVKEAIEKKRVKHKRKKTRNAYGYNGEPL